MNRHLELMGPDTRVIFNSDTIKAAEAGQGAQLCPMPVKQLTNNSKNKLAQNSVALGTTMSLLGLTQEQTERIIKQMM